MALAIRSYNNGSESVRNWRQLFNERTGGRNAVILRRTNSSFRLRPNDWVLNWGSSAVLPHNIANVRRERLINAPASVALATNKITCLDRLRDANINTVEYSTNMDYVFNNSRNSIWYERRVLQGHSGEGIAIVSNQPLQSVGNFPVTPHPTREGRLWTKAITGPRREFRIHVFNDTITNVQLKRRRNGFADNENYSEAVRNFHTGWVYTTSNISPNIAALSAAVRAIHALGLNFGAVDVITNRDDAWVLEVNTAPGMEGTNADIFVDALIAYTEGRNITPWSVDDAAADLSEELPVQAEAVAQPSPEATVREEARAPLEEPVQRVQPIPASPAPAGFSSLRIVEEGIYLITLNGENTEPVYAQYRNNNFYLFGFSVRLPVSTVQVVRRVV